jgi:hypothetical protein
MLCLHGFDAASWQYNGHRDSIATTHGYLTTAMLLLLASSGIPSHNPPNPRKTLVSLAAVTQSSRMVDPRRPVEFQLCHAQQKNVGPSLMARQAGAAVSRQETRQWER